MNYPDVLKNLRLEHKEVFGIYNQIKEIVLNNEYSLFEKIDAIQLLENNVVLEDSEGIFSTYNESEMGNIKMCIWLSASVARYSLYLWYSEEEGGFGLIDKLGNPKEYFIFSPEVSTNWKESNFTYNGKSKLNTNRLKRKDPPEWVYDDLWGTWTSALFTGNPFTAIAGGAVSSAVGELRRRY